MSTNSTLRLLGQHAGDVVLEAEPQADERLAEQLARLLVLESLVELLVRHETLAQQAARPRCERGSFSKKLWSRRAGRMSRWLSGDHPAS